MHRNTMHSFISISRIRFRTLALSPQTSRLTTKRGGLGYRTLRGLGLRLALAPSATTAPTRGGGWATNGWQLGLRYSDTIPALSSLEHPPRGAMSSVPSAARARARLLEQLAQAALTCSSSFQQLEKPPPRPRAVLSSWAASSSSLEQLENT